MDEFQTWVYEHSNATETEHVMAMCEITDAYDIGFDWRDYEAFKPLLWYQARHAFVNPLNVIDYGIAYLAHSFYSDESITRVKYLAEKEMIKAQIESLTKQASELERSYEQAQKNASETNPVIEAFVNVNSVTHLTPQFVSALVACVYVYNADRIEVNLRVVHTCLPIHNLTSYNKYIKGAGNFLCFSCI